MSKISRFTSNVVQLAKNAVGERGEVAAAEGGGGFAEYAVVALHCLRVYLEKSYREALDLLSEMPHILGEIGLNAADRPDHSTLVKWFDRIKTEITRHTTRLTGRLSQRGQPRQPRCRQRLRLDAITRKTPRRGRETADQTP